MLTRSWRRLRSPAAWAFVLTLGAPMLAEAQQGGLFPLAPIRRQRVPCQNENPVYGLYRHEYFGYHPTCWRRFPAGWGCPSPEAPDAAASFAKRPRDPAFALHPEDEEGPIGPDREGMGPDEPGMPGGPEEDQLPPLPEGRAPFQPDVRPDEAPAPRSTPRPSAPPAGPGSNPLELLPPPADTPGEKPASPAAAAAPAETSQGELPALPGPVESPLLALPDPSATAPSSPSTSVPTAAATAPGLETPAPGRPMLGPGASTALPIGGRAASNPTPAQAPRRTSLLGGLFSRTRR